MIIDKAKDKEKYIWWTQKIVACTANYFSRNRIEENIIIMITGFMVINSIVKYKKVLNKNIAINWEFIFYCQLIN